MLTPNVPTATRPAYYLTMDQVNAARDLVMRYANPDPAYPRATREQLRDAFQTMADWFGMVDPD